ncbi:hypothetical protein GF324_13080, partial [bacterium]|nr:hypothetical protein [bacterium]
MFAAEGIGFIVGAVMFTFITGFAGIFTKRKVWFLASAAGIVLWVFFLIFFRDPVRTLPRRDVLVSPVDGTVLEVLPLPNGGIRISVFLSLFNVHAVR